MSWEALRWALSARAPSMPSKLLLIIMANLDRPPAHKIFAKANTLADLAQMDRKTVLANLKRLEEAGLITRLPERAQRGGAPIFVLNVDLKAVAALVGSDTETDPTSGDASRSEVIPVFPRSDTAFSAKSTHFSPEVDPKAGHIEGIKQIEPVLNKNTRANKSRDLLTEFPELLKGVDHQVLVDWQALRRQKRAPITATVLGDIAREAGKADMTMNDALTMACARGWQGFRADWATGKAPGRRTGSSRHTGFDQLDYGKTGQAL